MLIEDDASDRAILDLPLPRFREVPEAKPGEEREFIQIPQLEIAEDIFLR